MYIHGPRLGIEPSTRTINELKPLKKLAVQYTDLTSQNILLF